MKRSISKKSITYKLRVFVIAIILFQAILFIASINFGGVIDNGKKNAYKAFSDTIENRNTYLQLEMKNNWTNLTPYMKEISENLNEFENDIDFFKKSTNTLINMLRSTNSSGAFIILNSEENEKQVPTFYLRDYDPFLNDFSNKDLYLFSGPSEIAKELQIPLDQNWTYSLTLTDENKDFYEKPLKNLRGTYTGNLLGYWSTPFCLTPEDSPVITYTVPFFDKDNQVRGVVGIEVSINYLQQFLPANEIQNKDSLGYMIGYKENKVDSLKPIVMKGALQERMIPKGEEIILQSEDEDYNLYKVLSHNSKDEIFAGIQKINLYLNNTPYEEEEWYLIGLIGKDSLLNYVDNIQKILYMSLLVAVLIGIIGSSYISYILTKPIISLSNKVRKSNRRDLIVHEETGLLEVDELAEAMATATNALLDSSMKMSKIIELVDVSIGAFEYNKEKGDVFLTDQLKEVLEFSEENMENEETKKYNFIKYLERIFQNPEPEEENIYFLPEKENKWIKIKTIETNNSVLGVALDVTKEINEKRMIKTERDYDNLTKIYNRNAGERLFYNVLKLEEDIQVAAVIMLDLDSLKEMNDNYGHNFGDAYIKGVAERLVKINSNGKSIVSRRSGDEFLVFLYKYPTEDMIREEMKDFFDDLEKHPMKLPDGRIIKISISAGLVWFRDKKTNYDDIINKADKAMYKAKNTQKGTLVEFGGDASI